MTTELTYDFTWTPEVLDAALKDQLRSYRLSWWERCLSLLFQLASIAGIFLLGMGLGLGVHIGFESPPDLRVLFVMGFGFLAIGVWFGFSRHIRRKFAYPAHEGRFLKELKTWKSTPTGFSVTDRNMRWETEWQSTDSLELAEPGIIVLIGGVSFLLPMSALGDDAEEAYEPMKTWREHILGERTR